MKKIISSPNAPKAVGPYSQAVISNGFLFVSGVLPLTLEGTLIDEIQAATHQIFKNLNGMCETAGTNLQNAVKMTVFLKDLNDFSSMNEVYSSYIKDGFPARSTIEVAGLPKGARIEIEGIFSV